MKQVRFGIIGVGNMGGAHARTLAGGKIDGAVLAAVADIVPDRIARIRGELPETVRYFDSAEAMMDSGAIDAVLVAVPHYEHPRLAMAGLARGLHVLVEKPAGVYTAQVREMNKAALGHPELKFGIMFNNRTNPVYIRMHDMVAAGELGEIKRTSWIITDWYRSQSYYDSGSWRATWKGEGGGVLLNQCPHNLDLWQWIVGMMPSRIRAFCHEGKWHDIEVEDDVTAYVEYPNGATGTFVTTTADTPGTNRFEITGDRGKLVAEEGRLVFHRLAVPEREWNATYKGGFGQPAVERIEIDTSGDFPNHAGILRDFTRAVITGDPLWAPGIEGIRSLEISNAMHLSSWLDKTVELPVDEACYFGLLQEKIAASAEKSGADATLDLKGSF